MLRGWNRKSSSLRKHSSRREGKATRQKRHDIVREVVIKTHLITGEGNDQEKKVCNSLKVILFTTTPSNFICQPFMEIEKLFLSPFDIECDCWAVDWPAVLFS